MMPTASPQTGPNYAAWEVDDSQYRVLPDLIRWAILAPSVYNTQPWMFFADQETILISPDLTRALPVFDPTQRQMYISIGAALGNLKIAGHYFGWSSQEEHLTRSGTNALSTRVDFRPGYKPTAADRALFAAITRRVTNRHPHHERPLPAQLAGRMSSLVSSYNCHLVLIDDQQRKNDLARLVYEGNLAIATEPGFANELALWVRPNTSSALDGMPGFGFGVPDFASRIFPKVARTGQISRDLEAHNRRLLERQTSTIGIIATDADTPHAWIAAGEALQVAALHAVGAGLAVHPLAVPIQSANAVLGIRRLASSDHCAQIMFRLGYPLSETPQSPRRPVGQVVAIGRAAERRLIAEDAPTIFRLEEGTYTLDDLRRDLGDVTVVDKYSEEWLTELFIIRNPEINFNSPSGQALLRTMVEQHAGDYEGAWIYFPWRRAVTHVLLRDEFLEVLYSRNCPSIEQEVQKRLGDLKIGIVGLSIGSNIARTLVMTGVQRLQLADFDTIAPSNSNRIGAGSVLTVGENKTTALAHDLYEFNPYLDVQTYPAGLYDANLDQFMSDLDIVIDHMSDVRLKLKVREAARRTRTFVIMASNGGLSPTFDVELPEDPQFFGGRVPPETLALMRSDSITFPQLARVVGAIFVLDEMPATLAENFLNILAGRQNYGSQLGLTGYAVAAQVAYLVYEIARGNAKRLARFKRLHLEQPDLFDPAEAERARQAYRAAFRL